MKTADEIINDANRIKAFLADPVIAGALTNMERRIYEDLLVADSSDKRVVAHASAIVLRNFETELNKVFDAAETEVLKAAKTSAKS